MGATHKRDLRSGHSIWQRRPLPGVPERRLVRDTRCDVLIVGAGISGALAAEQLTDAGLSIVVIDRRGAVRGSTLASTALLQYEIDTPLSKLATRIGMDARRTHLAPLAARGRRPARSEPPARHHGGLRREELALPRGQRARRCRPAGRRPRRRRAGFEVRLLSASAVRDAYGIRWPRPQSRSQPTPPGGGLSADRAGARRANARSKPCRQRTAHNGVSVLTDQATIRARHVVFATGYELPKGVPRKGHRIATTWVIATRPQPRGLWSGHGFIWEASDPCLFARQDRWDMPVISAAAGGFSDADRRDSNAQEDRHPVGGSWASSCRRSTVPFALYWCSADPPPVCAPSVGR